MGAGGECATSGVEQWERVGELSASVVWDGFGALQDRLVEWPVVQGSDAGAWWYRNNARGG